MLAIHTNRSISHDICWPFLLVLVVALHRGMRLCYNCLHYPRRWFFFMKLFWPLPTLMYKGLYHSLRLWYSPIWMPVARTLVVRSPTRSLLEPTSILFQFQCWALGKLHQPSWCLEVRTTSAWGRHWVVRKYTNNQRTLCSCSLKHISPVIRIKQLCLKHGSKVRIPNMQKRYYTTNCQWVSEWHTWT